MNFIILLLFIIIAIFASIGIYSLISFLIGLYIYNKNKNAIINTWFNTLAECHKEYCPSYIKNISYPKPITNNKYNSDIANYCSDLIVRLDPHFTTKNIIELPKDLSLELTLYDNKKSPIFGMLCKNKDKDTAWLIFRGTANIREWIQDFTYEQLDYKIDDTNTLIHKGFWNIYNNFKQEIIDKIKTVKNLIIAGHSLGGGVAILAGVDLSMALNSIKNVSIYTFASPRVGNSAYANMVTNKINTNKLALYRIVNTSDIVPTLPFSVVPNFKDANDPLIYTDCGTLLNFTANWKSIINNHLMALYGKNIPKIIII